MSNVDFVGSIGNCCGAVSQQIQAKIDWVDHKVEGEVAEVLKEPAEVKIAMTFIRALPEILVTAALLSEVGLFAAKLYMLVKTVIVLLPIIAKYCNEGTDAALNMVIQEGKSGMLKIACAIAVCYNLAAVGYATTAQFSLNLTLYSRAMIYGVISWLAMREVIPELRRF